MRWDAETARLSARATSPGRRGRCSKNIETILAEAGASLKDVVKITIFAADISYRDAINKVRAEVFGACPASTQVAVAALVDPDWMVEIEAVAFVPQ